jgi:hypothetical protein
VTVAGAVPAEGDADSQFPPLSVRTATENAPGKTSLETAYDTGLETPGLVKMA